MDILARHECPAITARRERRAATLGTADDDPIVWDRAVGANVLDVDGNRYVDLTSGFGVALLGHRHPQVVAAAQTQTDTLIHAMGDAWPDATRIKLLERLASIAPEGLDVTLLGLSGSDAVDAAVKTAVLATGKTGVLTFEGGYHGLALGVLALQGYKASFTAPFADIAHPDVRRLPYGCDPDLLDEVLDGVGLVLVEPIQGRGGFHPAPSGWLQAICAKARSRGALVAFDEIQSGMGRTGAWFAGTELDAVPDLLCVGKALAGGFPLSACVGTRDVMNAWGASKGEALHTQTFLGHPVGCAAALASIDILERGGLEQVRATEAALLAALDSAGFASRGRGLMRAVDVGADALTTCRALLQAGFIALPAGATDVGLTPPMSLTGGQIEAFVAALVQVTR